MLIRAKSDKNIQARTVLFDSGYTADNLKLITRLGSIFVTTLKSNRLVSLTPEGEYIHLQDRLWDAERLEHGLNIKLKDLPFRVQLFKVVALRLHANQLYQSLYAVQHALFDDYLRAELRHPQIPAFS